MIQPKKRRKLGEKKRDRRLTINLTVMEFQHLEQKAREAGMTMAVYVRLMAMEGKVIARLGEEDRRLYREVVGVSNMLSAFMREGRETGTGEAAAGASGEKASSFEAARELVDRLLNTIKL